MSELSQQIFRMSSGTIGTFYCPPSHPVFHDTGPIRTYLIVFPRTSVTITHHGRAPVVADPNVVMFYNKGQTYYRDKISEQGDLCDWFSFSQDVVVEAIRAHDPAVDERWLTPFCFTHGPSDSGIYMQQRLLIHHLNQRSAPDALYVEEMALAILQQAITYAYQVRQTFPSQKRKASRLHIDLVQAAKEVLAARFKEPLSLEQIATAVYSSPYHLSRVFRKYTGLTIHNYLNQLRLRTALAYVTQPNTSLTDLGLELGYSSHSHFTQAFRRAFGAPPSTFRQTAATHGSSKRARI